MVFLRLANLFHKFVDKMTLQYFIFLLMKKELPKQIPSWELNDRSLIKGTGQCPKKYPRELQWMNPPPPSKLEWFINVIT